MTTCPLCGHTAADLTGFRFTVNALYYNGAKLDLRLLERELVQLILENLGRQIHWESLFLRLYGHVDDSPSSRTVTVYLSHIRREFYRLGVPITIKNNWRGLYQFTQKVGKEKL